MILSTNRKRITVRQCLFDLLLRVNGRLVWVVYRNVFGMLVLLDILF